MNPIDTSIKLVKVRDEMQSLTPEQLVDHPYISNQLDIYFGVKESKKIIGQFKANFMIMVTNPDIKKNLIGCDHFSMVQTLIGFAKDNLSLNPSDKECCIVKFGNKAVGIPMWRGRLKRMQERGAIKYIDYIEIRYRSDKFTDLGNGKFDHKINDKRPANDEMVEVLMVVIMPNNASKYKRVSGIDIAKRQKKSPMQNIWKEWAEEMWKKTAINIFESEIGVPKMESDIDDSELEEQVQNIDTEQYEQHEQPEEANNNVQEADVVEEQDVLLRNQLEGLKGLLPDDRRAVLESKIHTFTNRQLQDSIDHIKETLKKVKEDYEAKKEEAKKENESPLG